MHCGSTFSVLYNEKERGEKKRKETVSIQIYNRDNGYHIEHAAYTIEAIVIICI